MALQEHLRVRTILLRQTVFTHHRDVRRESAEYLVQDQRLLRHRSLLGNDGLEQMHPALRRRVISEATLFEQAMLLVQLAKERREDHQPSIINVV